VAEAAPGLSAEQIRIENDGTRYFHERLPTDHPRLLSFSSVSARDQDATV
jgi:hypothetical protein